MAGYVIMRNGIGKTKQYNLIMSEELYDRLKSVCKAADVRMSEVIRHGIELMLEDMGSLSAIKDTHPYGKRNYVEFEPTVE